MNSPARTIADALLQARKIVIFTGAGMSADSGIATFRDKPDSHWSLFNPDELASPQGWRDNHRRVWAWYEARRAIVLASQPNAGHLAIAQLANVLNTRTGHSIEVNVVTQNVDNLHERAGSTQVIHLHGSLFAPRCAACHSPGQFVSYAPDVSAIEVEPPHCEHCGECIRPGVVWFGEDLPQAQFRKARDLVNASDAMLVIGTSGVVYPAAELPINASEQGKFVAEINHEPSDLSPHMHVQWSVSAAQGLPQLLDLLRAT
jgi:NAD-dependent deacetylase